MNEEKLEREGWTLVATLKKPLDGVKVMSSDFGLVTAEKGSKYISVHTCRMPNYKSRSTISYFRKPESLFY